jgi:hypothetical protein
MTEYTYLKPAELVKRWNNAVTVGTLANWRSKKKGPPFARFGSRVLYRLDLVIAWEANNQVAANDNSHKGAVQNG